ncbi:MAG: M48 family metallopeptidase [Chitinophagales bacterium]|nr:M48 family metallopeptidase [Chitinophagales bacterium]MDW8418957.1 M48 family metallopeptidase [Chitinophagales bacterium]
MTAHQLLLLIVCILVADFLFDNFLSWLNLKTWDKPLPEPVADLYDTEKYRKAAAYARVNFRFSLISTGFTLAISLLFLLCGGYAWLDEVARNISSHQILHTLIFFGIYSLAASLIALPFEWYNTFVIEEKYGFNRTTLRTFISDKLKGIVLGALIAGPLLALLTWLFYRLGDNFWLAGWGVSAVFSIFMAMLYTSVWLPLFNKLTPLENGDLRKNIEEYASKVKFPVTNIFVMDGSKRTSKANAFFSGLGPKKDIVLFDTLINNMNKEEIVAVLAHEVGHYKHRHILQSMLISIAQMGILFFLFGKLSSSDLLAHAMGASQINFHLAIIAFLFLYTPVSRFIGVLFNLFSRKNEYEADAYAGRTYSAAPLISALKKLHVDQLSNLQPHPVYVWVNYSHPTLLQRIQALTNVR